MVMHFPVIANWSKLQKNKLANALKMEFRFANQLIFYPKRFLPFSNLSKYSYHQYTLQFYILYKRYNQIDQRTTSNEFHFRSKNKQHHFFL